MADSIPEQIEVWSTNLRWSIVSFTLVTLLFIGITVLIFSMGNLTEIAQNYPKYRCNPLMMPFAGQFGYDAKENFNFCISNILNEKASGIFAPLYGLLSQFVGILTVMMNATLGIRKLFSNFFLSVNYFVGNVRNKIQNLLFQIRISFLKLNNLMGRVFGTMYAVIYMGLSALTAANNTANNDLVKFLSEFCFDPATPIQLEDGSYKPIVEIKIGDRLAAVKNTIPVVTSTFIFDGRKTNMVSIEDVRLSEEHYVFYKGLWIEASSHPDAKSTEICERLVCLNVTGNEFYVGKNGLLARDYDEHSESYISKIAQNIATCALNGAVVEKTVDDYSLGFDPNLEIKMKKGGWKRATEIQIDDVLDSGNRVVGIVRERCGTTIVLPTGAKVSAAQLIFNGRKWIRAANANFLTSGSAVLIQLLTSNCGVIVARQGDIIYYLRDYREAPLPEMESPYRENLN